MKLDDFNNIDLKNAGSLPMPVKLVLLGFIFLVLVALGYWFLWSPEMDEFTQAEAKEQELRQVFTTKKAKPSKLMRINNKWLILKKPLEHCLSNCQINRKWMAC